MLKNLIKDQLQKSIKELGFETTDIDLYISENERFGDYTTNVPLQLAKSKSEKSYQSPLDIANAILSKFSGQDFLEKTEVVSPGFINFFIKDDFFVKNLEALLDLPNYESRKILIEYGHVNPLKEVHIGHLRTFILGESICRILEFAGHEVFRANYQGDIGLHIAKAIWGIKKIGMSERELTLEEKAEFLGKSYAEGNATYEKDVDKKTEIDQINNNLYQKDSETMKLYQLAREWSLSYFQPIYQLLGVKYDRCFFESEVYEEGKKIVLENIGAVFEKSEGAVIFPGEKYGLHNRVFLTSSGNPTYEGKEIGLAKLEFDTFAYDDSIHVVASEQEGYFTVVIKAIELTFPQLKGKKKHLSYGLVDLREGKMSSRTGNIITVNNLIEMTEEKIKQVQKNEDQVRNLDQDSIRKVALGAIKFAYLKFSAKTNMVFDLEQSVSLTGDSGVYLMYTYARAKSVLKKSQNNKSKPELVGSIEKEERAILSLLEQFPLVVEEATKEFQPNVICGYLIKLARAFNFFYEKDPIIGSNKEAFRLELVKVVVDVLSKGLDLLGIETLERI